MRVILLQILLCLVVMGFPVAARGMLHCVEGDSLVQWRSCGSHNISHAPSTTSYGYGDTVVNEGRKIVIVKYDFYETPVEVTYQKQNIYSTFFITQNGDEIEICDRPDSRPVVFETQEEIFDFAQKNLRYPDDSCVKGRIIFKALIDENGNILELRLLRGLSDEYNAAALEAAKKVKVKSPALFNGNPVKSTELIIIPYGYVI